MRPLYTRASCYAMLAAWPGQPWPPAHEVVMDFLKLLRSLEEFLYELCTWFLFFPRTLYRVIVHPQRMASYVDAELKQDAEHRFDDAISPPMFLMLAVLVAHGMEYLTHQVYVGTSEISRTVFGNQETLLLYRSIGFAVWPLVATVHLLRRKRSAMTRESLRHPFYTQCYLTAPFALVFSAGTLLITLPGQPSTIVGAAGVTLACLWYAIVQMRWLRAGLGCSWRNAFASTLWVLVLGIGINVLIGSILLSG